MNSWWPVLLSVSLAACGGAKPAPTALAQAATSVPPGARPPKPAPAAMVRALRRSSVRDALAQGLGRFLQRIELEDQPVRVNGKFHGFRIAVLRDAPFWSGVDLKPGDVVTQVNGFPIERPEQAQTAFESLELAGELRVAYEREGQARELVYAIVDDL
jgi:type II secretory pathway component PulC